MTQQASLFGVPGPTLQGKILSGTNPARGARGKARPYQVESREAIFAQWALGHRSVLLVLATGLGKTFVFGEVAAQCAEAGERVLILAHRDELIDQARDRMAGMTGRLIGREQAGFWAEHERIVIASVQTLGTSDTRLQRFASDPFTVIIIDEAHHALAATYRKIIDFFPDAKVLGVTATPDRGDGLALGEVFQSVADQDNPHDLQWGIDNGYCADVVMRQIIVKEVDLSRVRTTAGDLNLGDVDKEMLKANFAVAENCLELCGDRLTIVFSTKVETAHDLARLFNTMAKRTVAACVDGKMKRDDRRAVLKAHARREFQYLINVGIATEGYDCPAVSAIAIARPTKSRGLYVQMAGRGSRVCPGDLIEGIDDAGERCCQIAMSDKPDFMLLDFSGNSGKHDLAHPLDILGGKEVTPEERQLQKEALKSAVMAPRAALQIARHQIEAERERRARIAAEYEAKIKADVIARDAFRKHAGNPKDFIDGSGALPATMGQRSKLMNEFKLPPEAVPVTKKAANDLIGHLAARKAKGLCTWKQTQQLTKYGISSANTTIAQASEIIGWAFDHDYRSPPIEFVDKVLRRVRQAGEEG